MLIVQLNNELSSLIDELRHWRAFGSEMGAALKRCEERYPGITAAIETERETIRAEAVAAAPVEPATAPRKRPQRRRR